MASLQTSYCSVCNQTLPLGWVWCTRPVNADVYVAVDDMADMFTDEETVELLQGDEETSPVPSSSVAIKSADLLHSYLVHCDNVPRSLLSSMTVSLSRM